MQILVSFMMILICVVGMIVDPARLCTIAVAIEEKSNVFGIRIV